MCALLRREQSEQEAKAQISTKIFNFTEDQDLRLKFGVDMMNKESLAEERLRPEIQVLAILECAALSFFLFPPPDFLLLASASLFSLSLSLSLSFAVQTFYGQVRENNWTFNTDFRGYWGISYDL